MKGGKWSRGQSGGHGKVPGGPSTLTSDEDEEAGGRQEAEILGGASEPPSEGGLAGGGVIEVLPDAVAPHLLVLGGQLHLHLAVVSFHVLGQVEACVRVRLPIKLQKQRELGEKLANLGSKLLIIAAGLTILDMVDLAWSISASQVSRRRKQAVSRKQL